MAMKIAIVGRGHTGKNALARAIADKLGLTVLKTSTDRPKRWPKEDTYHFYTKEQSDAIPEDDKLFYSQAVDGHGRWTDKADFLAADIAILDPPGTAQAVYKWQANGYDVCVIYVSADANDRRTEWIKDIIENGGDQDEAEISFNHREAIEAPMFDQLENIIRTAMQVEESDALLYPNATAKPFTLYHADKTLLWQNPFDMDAMRDFVGRIGQELPLHDRPAGGYRVFATNDPLILEPEDWTRDEWAVIMKLLGLEPQITERAVIHNPLIKCYINPSVENKYKGEK